MTFVSFSLWVMFSATEPAPASPRPRDVEICTLRGRFTVVDDGKPIVPEYALVFVSTSLAKYSSPPSETTMVQKNRAFIPSVVVMQRNDTLVIENAEDGAVVHEAHADRDVNLFAAPASPRAKTARHEFSSIGETFIRCSKHKTMKATVLTVPNRFHTRVDASGGWSLSIPTGGVQLSFWSLTPTHHNTTGLFVRNCDEAIELTTGPGKPLPPEPGPSY